MTDKDKPKEEKEYQSECRVHGPACVCYTFHKKNKVVVGQEMNILTTEMEKATVTEQEEEEETENILDEWIHNKLVNNISLWKEKEQDLYDATKAIETCLVTAGFEDCLWSPRVVHEYADFKEYARNQLHSRLVDLLVLWRATEFFKNKE